MPITAVARADLSALAFRDGYAPFAPFTGRLQDEVEWTALTKQRLSLLLQPLGLWGGQQGYNKSEVAVSLSDESAALPQMLRVKHVAPHFAQAQNEACITSYVGSASLDYFSNGTAASTNAAKILAHLPAMPTASPLVPRAGHALHRVQHMLLSPVWPTRPLRRTNASIDY